MKKLLAVALCSLPMALATTVYAQSTAPAPGGSATTPAPSTENADKGTAAGPADTGDSAAATQAASGWSVKDQIIGETVYNDKKEKVGDINDVIISPDGKAIYFIVGAGGFLGMGEHAVALPFDKITKTGDTLTLQGYTKDQLKAMPEFKPPEPEKPAAGGAMSGGMSGGTTGGMSGGAAGTTPAK